MPPIRVQRSRKKGWKMPANTIYVGRGSAFGNPFIIGAHGTAQDVVKKYRDHIKALIKSKDADFNAGLGKLRGRNLACWCDLSSPCHADVLLDIVNVK